MGIYNRDYYRDLPGGAGAWGMMPVVKYLIFANIILFILQLVVVHPHQTSLEDLSQRFPEYDTILKQYDGPDALDRLRKDHPHLYELMTDADGDAGIYSQRKVSVIQEWCELETNKVVKKGQVWRLLTHAFCHDRYSIVHIVFNMLLLYWFGGTLESMYGSREFLLFYLTAAVVAGLTYVGLDLYTGSSVPAVGASGAVMAVMMLYTVHFPRETICICWFFPVEMRWVMLFYLIFDLHPILLALSGDHFFSGIAHAAHLGGLAFGFLYGRYQWRLEPIVDRLSGVWRKRERTTVRRPAPEMRRVDEILEKITATGQDSLTAEERAVLASASRQMKRRPQCGG
jgi:membrane associated rhomboid family serine protease